MSDEDVPHLKHLYRFRTIAGFEADIDFMLRHYTPVGLLDLLAHLRNGQRLPRRPLLLSIDDGFREGHDVIAPILRAKGVPATFFLTTAFLDNNALCHNEKSSLLIERLSGRVGARVLADIHSALDRAGIRRVELSTRLLSVPYDRRPVLDEIATMLEYDFGAYLKTARPYLTSGQVRALLKDGFTVGAHSIDHPVYEKLSTEQQLHQTRGSVHELKVRFGLSYAAFAFPYTEVGVPKVFFDIVMSSGDVDVTFGTRGLLIDELPFHLQRFTMEGTSQPAKRILARQYARGFWKRFTGRGVVKRADHKVSVPPTDRATGAVSRYGSTAWLESRYQESEDDPWGLSWRAIEQCRYDAAIDLLKRNVFKSGTRPGQFAVLDVGCSTGHFTHRLAALNTDVLGIDLSETAVARARRSYPDISFRRAAVTDPSLSSKGFDLISCLEVLYYVERDAQVEFLSALRSALKPNCQALVSSVIGEPPYFYPHELIGLLSRHFNINSVDAYGCSIWARFEGWLFRLCERSEKALRVLSMERERTRLGIARADGELTHPYWRRLLRQVARRRVLARIAEALLATPSHVTRPVLRATLLVRVFNNLAARLSLRRTHTHVIVSRD